MSEFSSGNTGIERFEGIDGIGAIKLGFSHTNNAIDTYNSIVEDGRESLVAVFDLDGLLVRKKSLNGENITSWHSMYPFMNLEERMLHREYLLEYGPPEEAGVIDPGDSDHWTRTILSMMVRPDTDREVHDYDIRRSAEKTMRLAPGAKRLLGVCALMKVPVIIKSAAAYPAVQGVLDRYGIPFDPSHIIANRFKTNDNGVITGLPDKLVHSTNKGDFPVTELPGCAGRPNAVVAGDNVLDRFMGGGVDGDGHRLTVLHNASGAAKEDDLARYYARMHREFGIDIISLSSALYALAWAIEGIARRRSGA